MKIYTSGGCGHSFAGPNERICFYGARSIAKPTVKGAKGANPALACVFTAPANLGFITDSTT